MTVPSAASYSVKARRCEANAVTAETPKVRQQFLKAAEIWLRIAGKREHSERSRSRKRRK